MVEYDSRVAIMNKRTGGQRIDETGRDLRSEKLGETTAEIEARISRTVASYAHAFPDVDPRALASHLELVITGNAVANGLARHIAGAGFDVTRPRFTLLRLLYLSPEQRLLQNEIAREMAVTSANVTQIIDSLEEEGWVERVVSPTDRRFTYAQLTPAGVEACDRLVPAIVEFMASTCGALTPDEQAQLIELLRRVRSHLKSLYAKEA